jgi:XRE family transcriptional regulator, regulator of sulfur utilization
MKHPKSQAVMDAVRKLRTHLGISQESLAQAIGMSQAAYCNLENGKTKLNIDDLERIALELNTTVPYILQLAGFDSPPNFSINA